MLGKFLCKLGLHRLRFTRDLVFGTIDNLQLVTEIHDKTKCVRCGLLKNSGVSYWGYHGFTSTSDQKR